MIVEDQLNSVQEKAFVRQALKGRLEAFNQLVLRYQNMAYHHAVALLGDYALAEDIAQESFTKAFKSTHRFRGVHSDSGYSRF